MRQKPKFEDGSLTRMAGKEIGKLEEYISEEGLPERKITGIKGLHGVFRSRSDAETAVG